jgi:glycolate oxidase
VDDAFVGVLSSLAGPKNVISARERMEDYSHDEYSQAEIRHYPEVVVRPESAAQVGGILKACSERRVPVTCRGGGTGLCGGSVPVFGGVVLSLEKMNRVLELDMKNLVAVVEAGLTLADFYRALEGTGLFFPPHPGDESATLGGVIATNAGGARAIKYGVVRNFVKGLEVVLADGRIEQVGGKFVKNSSGYSLLNLLVGSEGTLAVVTKAVIGLMRSPAAMVTLVAPFPELKDAISAVPAILQASVVPMAVEFLEREAVILGEAHLGRQWPVKEGKAYLMIILDGSGEEEVLDQAGRIQEICSRHRALDVFIADNRQKQENILTIRSQIYEALKVHMLESLDVTVPRAEIAEFVEEAQEAAAEEGMWMPTYGHAADGNVHNHLMKDAWKDGVWTEIPGWREKYPRLRLKIHSLGIKYRGTVSGEHGIGLVKKEYLSSFIGESQVGLMAGIKRVFDPGNILNPGKIFDIP